jgi:hypothetical protein
VLVPKFMANRDPSGMVGNVLTTGLLIGSVFLVQETMDSRETSDIRAAKHFKVFIISTFNCDEFVWRLLFSGFSACSGSASIRFIAVFDALYEEIGDWEKPYPPR